MRIPALFVLLLIVTPLAAIGMGEKAPDFEFGQTWNLGGGLQSLASLRGKPVLVEHWATWCGPCVDNVPHLNQIHTAYADKGLTIIAVSNEDRATIADFVARMGMRYGVVQSTRAAALYGVTGIPHAFLVDAAGTIIWRGHPGKLESRILDQVMAGTFVPATIEQGEDTGWLVFLAVLGVFFLAALGWFIYKSGDRSRAPNVSYTPYVQHPGQPPGHAPLQQPGPPPR